MGHGEQKKRKKNKVKTKKKNKKNKKTKKRGKERVGNEMLAKVCVEKSKMGGKSFFLLDLANSVL